MTSLLIIITSLLVMPFVLWLCFYLDHRAEKMVSNHFNDGRSYDVKVVPVSYEESKKERIEEIINMAEIIKNKGPDND